MVNIYKHGKGNSLNELKEKYPEYLTDPLSRVGGSYGIEYLDHTHLAVSDDQILGFSDAIIAFWKDVPESIVESENMQVPDWFGKAILKDRKEKR